VTSRSWRRQYAKCLRQKNATIKINDLIFLHGGIRPEYASSTPNLINGSVHAELTDFSSSAAGVTRDSTAKNIIFKSASSNAHDSAR
jgi:hypothetical protein